MDIEIGSSRRPASGIIDDRDQLRLPATDVRPEHGIGLPELARVLHAEGLATFVVFIGRVLERFILVDEATEGIACDLAGVQRPFLDTEPIDRRLGGQPVLALSSVLRWMPILRVMKVW